MSKLFIILLISINVLSAIDDYSKAECRRDSNLLWNKDLDICEKKKHKKVIKQNVQNSIQAKHQDGNIEQKTIVSKGIHKQSFANGLEFYKKEKYLQAQKVFNNECLNKNNAEACFYLAKMHYFKDMLEGQDLNKTDYFGKKAFATLNKECTNNDAKSCDQLSDMYYFSWGVKKNKDLSNELEQKSCNLGYEKACESILDKKSSSYTVWIYIIALLLTKYLTSYQNRGLWRHLFLTLFFPLWPIVLLMMGKDKSKKKNIEIKQNSVNEDNYNDMLQSVDADFIDRNENNDEIIENTDINKIITINLDGLDDSIDRNLLHFDERFHKQWEWYRIALLVTIAYYADSKITKKEKNFILREISSTLKSNVHNKKYFAQKIFIDILHSLKTIIDKNKTPDEKYKLALDLTSEFSFIISELVGLSNIKNKDQECIEILSAIKQITKVDFSSILDTSYIFKGLIRERNLLDNIFRNFELFNLKENFKSNQKFKLLRNMGLGISITIIIIYMVF